MRIGETLPESSRTVFGIEGVPGYRVDEFAPKKHRFLVCVFVINEGNRIRKQLAEMSQFSEILDIAVADGGSTDGSLEASYLQGTNVRTLITKLGAGKLSAQMRMAFHYALQQGYDGVITIDGNGKDGVDALPNFVDLLDQGFDHIQGSRYIPGGFHENTPVSRHLALKFIHAPLISIASGAKQTDTTNGFRAYSSNLLMSPDLEVFRDVFQTYELHYHLAIESARNSKFKTIETPVSRVYPATGKTPTKISPVKGNAHVLNVLWKAATGKYRVKKERI